MEQSYIKTSLILLQKKNTHINKILYEKHEKNKQIKGKKKSKYEKR